MFIGEAQDLNNLPKLKSILPACNIIFKPTIKALSEIAFTAARFKTSRGEQIDAIVSNNAAFLRMYVEKTFGVAKVNAASISNYEGSVFDYKLQGRNIPLLFIPPIDHIWKKDFGKFLFQRYFSKLFGDTQTRVVPELDWTRVTEETVHKAAPEIIKMFADAKLVAVDIETAPFPIANSKEEFDQIQLPCKKEGLGFYGVLPTASGNKSKKWGWIVPVITMVGFTGIFEVDGKLKSYTVVVDFHGQGCYNLIKALCENDPPKSMQRGQYDCAYLMRFGIAPKNYLWDTHFLMHAWYAELPRDLAFIAAFTIKNFQYWKDEMGGDTFHYCAKDCHVTAWATIFLLMSMPDWAKVNYTKSFKHQFPNITVSLDGLKIDQEARKEVRKQTLKKLEILEREMREMVSYDYNASSPPQTLNLMHAVLYKRAEDSSKQTMEKFRDANPLYRVLADQIQNIRNTSKALSNYINFLDFDNRLLYELNAAGTDSSRFASKSSPFWCGTQVQNIPPYAKSMFITDEGFEFGAIDNSQSESRTTAYISGDPVLIDTVETAKDFHTRNAALFFGFTEEYLFDLKAEKNPLYKAIRDTSKRVNHGANYNMGAYVLLNTMGAKAVAKAKDLLGLPAFYSLIQVCDYLLNSFDTTYKIVRGEFQQKIIDEVSTTSMMTTPSGWTRYCFGDIVNGPKHILNSYISHKPQCQSVQMINDAYYDTWYDLQIKKDLIRTKAQIHDEIFFCYKTGTEDQVFPVISDYMRRPVETEHGTLVIPNDEVRGGYTWADLKS